MSVSDSLILMITFGSFLLTLIGLVIEIVKNVKK
ncbi:putative holin-like toxin [Lactococcus formosensis subsp. bovis]|uniref:Holin n=1 Tax=Lactococcus petauri TaxID=1940789 RepID=A0A252CFA3_9LACT|nr:MULTISPECIES: putative holin-like toxin [Lactococcus]OUK05231.1 holin [Lactococcus petauri]